MIRSQVDAELSHFFEYPWYSARVRAPKQGNGYDCGIFLLEFVARFLHNPQSLICNPKSAILNLTANPELEYIHLINSEDAGLDQRESDFICENILRLKNSSAIPEAANLVSATYAEDSN